MRFVSFTLDSKDTWGAVIGSDHQVVELGSVFGSDLKSIIAEDRLGEAQAKAQDATTTLKMSDLDLKLPIPNPGKIACIGVNYANRNAEYKDKSDQPKFPSLFMRTPDSFNVHDQPLWRPPESDKLDYEGEIVIVIGKEGRRISEDNAYDHIAGLTIMNEGTLRDWVRHAKFNVTQGKNFINSGAIGPWMVSADEFTAEQYEDMRVTTKVNGEIRQNDTTASMMFPFKYIISYCSKFFHLKPGDMIATGTPIGAGARFDPPKYLVPGDVIEVEVEGVGKLVNGVIDEPL
jgi:5-carboxymethyl-2-hydroxymuconate isomerase